jgi:ribonucleoside-diphosphate reductase alpha subunit
MSKHADGAASVKNGSEMTTLRGRVLTQGGMGGTEHKQHNNASGGSRAGGLKAAAAAVAMYVVKRSGRKEVVSFDKITARIKKLCYGLNEEFVDAAAVSQKVVQGVYGGVTTSELDELAAETAAAKCSAHPDYGILAARVAVSNLHKNTNKVFSKVMTLLHTYVHPKTGRPAPLLSDAAQAFIQANAQELDGAVLHDRDYEYDYFAFRTLERSYLLKLHGKVAERPQIMLMRVSCGIHIGDVKAAIRTYELTSRKFFTHASPTLFNSGTPKPQMSSCFLQSMQDDSIAGIYNTLAQCATISKFAGGIGLAVSNVRATGSYIAGTNGHSNGLVPMLRVFNSTARYVDQCFPASTPVLTPSGWLPISSLVAHSSHVLSHSGTPQLVEQLLKHSASPQPLYNIKTGRGQVRVTGLHPFWCLRGHPYEAERVRNRLGAKIAELTWEDASSLEPGSDWLALPKLCARQVETTLAKDVLMHEEWVLYRVLSVEKDVEKYEGALYDLEVAGEHSYVTEAGAVHNGGGKRKGSIAVYLEPWHADIEAFLELRKNQGAEESRARDLFLALWTPDLFMERVQTDGTWSLFCPHEAPGLQDAWGDDFKALYTRYEQTPSLVRKTMKARELWQRVITAQTEGGAPYMLYKDAVNRKSNYKHIGTIRSSNLCTEIVEFTSAQEIAVCNLASLGLPKYVTPDLEFDFESLYEVTQVATHNLNKVIDNNFYPLPEAKLSNMRHRPIGLGVQGLADTMALMRIPYETPAGRALNRDVFETIYFAALSASCDLAERDGPYESYAGSPASKGILQYDMWGIVPTTRWDWAGLKRRIAKHGLRNAMLVAPMPTATTSQMLGNNESFEPFTSNLYARRTIAGEFICVNRYLLQELADRGMWSLEMRDKLVKHGGSVQHVDEIPADLKDIYKTVWEIKLSTQLTYAADRGAFIDQSQSFNVHMRDISSKKLTDFHFAGWKAGLKTGSYYIRSEAAVEATQFTVAPSQRQPPARTIHASPAGHDSATKSTLIPPTTRTLISGQGGIAGTSVPVHQMTGPTQERLGSGLAVFDVKMQGVSPSALFDASGGPASPHARPQKRPIPTPVDVTTTSLAPAAAARFTPAKTPAAAAAAGLPGQGHGAPEMWHVSSPPAASPGSSEAEDARMGSLHRAASDGSMAVSAIMAMATTSTNLALGSSHSAATADQAVAAAATQIGTPPDALGLTPPAGLGLPSASLPPATAACPRRPKRSGTAYNPLDDNNEACEACGS